MADPVADFLAREQDMFAEFDGAPPAAVPAAEPIDNDFGDLQAANEPDQQPAVESVPNIDSGVDLEGLAIEDSAPVANNASVDTPPAEPLVNGSNGSTYGGSVKGSSPVQYSLPRIEAEKIRLWKEQQKKVLEEKDAQEEKKKSELKEAAKKELEEWYKQREKTLQLSHEENLKNEKSNQEMFAKQQDGEAQWDTVNKLVDQQKSKSGKDLSRLKTLLTGLKHMNSTK